MQDFDNKRKLKMMDKLLQNNKGPLSNDLVQQILAVIFTTFLKFMETNKKKLLVDASSEKQCNTLQEISP